MEKSQKNITSVTLHPLQQVVGGLFEIRRGEKANKCNQCDFAFSQAGSLRSHLMIHNGGKSNIFNKCDYASSLARELRKHLKTHFVDTVETKQTDTTSVTMHAMIHPI